jgi:predicted ester cyclase
MPTEENKAIVRRAYLDGLNHDDLSVIDDVFDKDYVAHFPGTPPIQGIETAKEFLREFPGAFPDIEFTIEDQVAEGDKVVTRWSAQRHTSGRMAGAARENQGDSAQ